MLLKKEDKIRIKNKELLDSDIEFKKRREEYVKMLNKGKYKNKRIIYDGVLRDYFKNEIIFLEWLNYNYDKISNKDKEYMKMFIRLMSDWYENR
jgi:hypothetical protein